MIDKIYSVIVVDPKGEETLYAMTVDGLDDVDGPRQMQAASGNPKIARSMFEFAKREFPQKNFKLAEFVRAN